MKFPELTAIRITSIAFVVLQFSLVGCHSKGDLGTEMSVWHTIEGGGPSSDRLGRYAWLKHASAPKRKQFWNNTLVVPQELRQSSLDLVLEQGTKEERDEFFPILAAKIDWKTMTVGVDLLNRLKPYASIFRTNPEFDKSVHRGICSGSSQINATSEELGKMDFDEMIKLSEASSFLDKHQYSNTFTLVRSLLKSDPDNEVLNEFYLITLRQSSG